MPAGLLRYVLSSELDESELFVGWRRYITTRSTRSEPRLPAGARCEGATRCQDANTSWRELWAPNKIADDG